MRPSEEQFEVGYEALLDDRECIVDAGYLLPLPPSYQAWREIDGRWNPFSELPPSLTQEEIAALITLCSPAGT